MCLSLYEVYRDERSRYSHSIANLAIVADYFNTSRYLCTPGTFFSRRVIYYYVVVLYRLLATFPGFARALCRKYFIILALICSVIFTNVFKRIRYIFVNVLKNFTNYKIHQNLSQKALYLLVKTATKSMQLIIWKYVNILKK